MTRRDFTNARANAKRRGLMWALSFEEWAEIWRLSGKWSRRGRKRGEYQMDRRVNALGYVPGNVQIVSGSINRTKDSPHGWRPKLSPESVQQIRAAYAPRKTTKRMLALRHKVSVACIKAVLSRRNWKSV